MKRANTIIGILLLAISSSSIYGSYRGQKLVEQPGPASIEEVISGITDEFFDDKPMDQILKRIPKPALLNSRHKGHTPMTYAIAMANQELSNEERAKYKNRKILNIIQKLHRYGANLVATDKDGLTPLHWAAKTLNDELVEWLLAQGIPYAPKDKDERNPLHYVMQVDYLSLKDNLGHDNLELVKNRYKYKSAISILESFEQWPELLSQEDNKGATPYSNIQSSEYAKAVVGEIFNLEPQ